MVWGMAYMTPRNAIRAAIDSGLTEESSIMKFAQKQCPTRARTTIERTLRDMVKAGQLVRKAGQYYVPLSAPVSTAPPPPDGGDAVRRATRRDVDEVEDVSDTDMEIVVWNRLHRTRKLSVLTDAQVGWMARKGYLRLSDRGKEWFRE